MWLNLFLNLAVKLSTGLFAQRLALVVSSQPADHSRNSWRDWPRQAKILWIHQNLNAAAVKRPGFPCFELFTSQVKYPPCIFFFSWHIVPCLFLFDEYTLLLGNIYYLRLSLRSSEDVICFLPQAERKKNSLLHRFLCPVQHEWTTLSHPYIIS